MVIKTSKYILVEFNRGTEPHHSMTLRLYDSSLVQGFFIQEHKLLIKFFRSHSLDVMKHFAYNSRTSKASFARPFLDYPNGVKYFDIFDVDIYNFLKDKSKNIHKIKVSAPYNTKIPEFFFTRIYDLQGVFKVTKNSPRPTKRQFNESMTLHFTGRPSTKYFDRLKELFLGYKVKRLIRGTIKSRTEATKELRTESRTRSYLSF